MMTDPRIFVYGGGLVNPDRLTPDDVSIDVIAHALSNTCRFGGHTREFYSVAEHSVRVAELCPRSKKLEGLLHDAAEAYVGDVIRPLKHRVLIRRGDVWHDLASLADYEQRVLDVIFGKFGVTPGPLSREVAEADDIALESEIDVLIRGRGRWSPLPLTPEEAKRQFLDAFRTIRADMAAREGVAV